MPHRPHPKGKNRKAKPSEVGGSSATNRWSIINAMINGARLATEAYEKITKINE